MPNNPTSILVVAAALARPDGQWLMHRRPLEKMHGGLWEFPGGKVEASENTRQALVRELAEELDIAVDPRALEPMCFADNCATDADPSLVILLYICREWRGDPVEQEGGTIGWFWPEQALCLDRPPLDIALCERLFGKNRAGDKEGPE